MNFASRPALVFFGCAALAATQLYACGIELDVAPDDDAGPSSGTSGRTSSGSPSSSSSSSGSSSGGSSGSLSSSSGSVVDADVPDAPNCTTYTLAGADLRCALGEDAGTATYAVSAHDVFCTRVGGASDAGDVLTIDANAQLAGFWVAYALDMTHTFDVEAAIEITGTQGGLGAGFALALVNPNADASSLVPTAGGTGTGLGFSTLNDFAGVGMAAQTYNGLYLNPTAVPNAALPIGSDASADNPAQAGKIYGLTMHHTGGATNVTGDFFAQDGHVLVNPVPAEQSLTDTPVVASAAFVGLTAATGAATTSQQRLVSFTIVDCAP